MLSKHFVLSVKWSAISQILMKMLACNKIITICNLPTIILRKYLKELKIKNCLGQTKKALLLYTDSNRKKWVWINKYIHIYIYIRLTKPWFVVLPGIVYKHNYAITVFTHTGNWISHSYETGVHYFATLNSMEKKKLRSLQTSQNTIKYWNYCVHILQK
jgi:hypothetical protein